MNMQERHQFVTFYIGAHLFGIEVGMVQEIIRYQEVTLVPLAPPAVQGLINLRGQIITALDLRRRLKLQLPALGRLPLNVVIRAGDEAISLLVDEIGDVLKVEEAAFEAVPDTLQGETREFIRGVYKFKDKLLLLLDTGKVVSLNA